jgi:hypothetical protein
MTSWGNIKMILLIQYHVWIISNSNMTSFFSFVNKRSIYRLGIISLAHAPVHVTDFPVVNVHAIGKPRASPLHFTFEYSSNNNIFSFVAMSADSVPSSKTNIFQSKLYTLVYCRHFRTYSRCAMFYQVNFQDISVTLTYQSANLGWVRFASSIPRL